MKKGGEKMPTTGWKIIQVAIQQSDDCPTALLYNGETRGIVDKQFLQLL